MRVTAPISNDRWPSGANQEVEGSSSMHMISCPHCGTMIRVDGGVANAPPYQITGGSFDGDSSHTRNINTSAAPIPVSLPSITDMIKDLPTIGGSSWNHGNNGVREAAMPFDNHLDPLRRPTVTNTRAVLLKDRHPAQSGFANFVWKNRKRGSLERGYPQTATPGPSQRLAPYTPSTKDIQRALQRYQATLLSLQEQNSKRKKREREQKRQQQQRNQQRQKRDTREEGPGREYN